MSQTFTPEVRTAFFAVADVLIPETGGMPSASGAEIGATVERILALRPDLQEAFYRGIEAIAGKDPATAARTLNVEDPKALAAIV